MITQNIKKFKLMSKLLEQIRNSISTQNQASSVILFMYKHVLEQSLEDVGAVRAKNPKRRPIVLSRPEVALVIDNILKSPSPNEICIFAVASRGKNLELT